MKPMLLIIFGFLFMIGETSQARFSTQEAHHEGGSALWQAADKIQTQSGQAAQYLPAQRAVDCSTNPNANGCPAIQAGQNEKAQIEPRCLSNPQAEGCAAMKVPADQLPVRCRLNSRASGCPAMPVLNPSTGAENAKCEIPEGTALMVAQTDAAREKFLKLQDGYTGADVQCSETELAKQMKRRFGVIGFAQSFCRNNFLQEQKDLKAINGEFFNRLNLLNREPACSGLVALVTGRPNLPPVLPNQAMKEDAKQQTENPQRGPASDMTGGGTAQ